MSVNLPFPQKSELKPVKGFEMGIAKAGIKKADRKDLLVMRLAPGSQVAGVFTLNRFCAAPVQVCREHLAQEGRHGEIRALVVNTGNANAGTGEQGMKHALETCAALAKDLGIKPDWGLDQAAAARNFWQMIRPIRRHRWHQADTASGFTQHPAEI